MRIWPVKIVDHRKQDRKSPQEIGWFIHLPPLGNRSDQREAGLKYPKNPSHALRVFSTYWEGFPNVSRWWDVLMGDALMCAVLLCCCIGQMQRWWKCPKMGTAAGTGPCSPCPEAQGQPWGAGQDWASH